MNALLLYFSLLDSLLRLGFSSGSSKTPAEVGPTGLEPATSTTPIEPKHQVGFPSFARKPHFHGRYQPNATQPRLQPVALFSVLNREVSASSASSRVIPGNDLAVASLPTACCGRGFFAQTTAPSRVSCAHKKTAAPGPTRNGRRGPVCPASLVDGGVASADRIPPEPGGNNLPNRRTPDPFGVRLVLTTRAGPLCSDGGGESRNLGRTRHEADREPLCTQSLHVGDSAA